MPGLSRPAGSGGKSAEGSGWGRRDPVTDQSLSCSRAGAWPCPPLHSEQTHMFSGLHIVLCPHHHIKVSAGLTLISFNPLASSSQLNLARAFLHCFLSSAALAQTQTCHHVNTAQPSRPTLQHCTSTSPSVCLTAQTCHRQTFHSKTQRF